jgi:hypothetical protein
MHYIKILCKRICLKIYLILTFLVSQNYSSQKNICYSWNLIGLLLTLNILDVIYLLLVCLYFHFWLIDFFIDRKYAKVMSYGIFGEELGSFIIMAVSLNKQDWVKLHHYIQYADFFQICIFRTQIRIWVW